LSSQRFQSQLDLLVAAAEALHDRVDCKEVLGLIMDDLSELDRLKNTSTSDSELKNRLVFLRRELKAAQDV
jgi:hypothetical protein